MLDGKKDLNKDGDVYIVASKIKSLEKKRGFIEKKVSAKEITTKVKVKGEDEG